MAAPARLAPALMALPPAELPRNLPTPPSQLLPPLVTAGAIGPVKSAAAVPPIIGPTPAPPAAAVPPVTPAVPAAVPSPASSVELNPARLAGTLEPPTMPAVSARLAAVDGPSPAGVPAAVPPAPAASAPPPASAP